MNRLYLMRHAPAGPRPAGSGDRDRRLTPAGRRAVKALATRLKSAAVAPAIALCSPARRARESLDLLRAELGWDGAVTVEEPLYLADAPTLLARLRAVDAAVDSVLLVGHNPGLEDLTRMLAPCAAHGLEAGFPAAGLAVFEVPGPWSALGRTSARLAALIAPP